MSFLRKLHPSEVEFSVEAVEESDSPDPEAYHNGSMNVASVEREKTWAWCEIIVRARWHRFTGQSMLPRCCYESKEDFINNSGLYDDMCMSAVNDLQGSLDRLANRLAPLLTQESFNEWNVEKVQNG